MGGLFAAISRDSSDVETDVFYGTDYHSHRGSEYAGIAGSPKGNNLREIHRISSSSFRSKFKSDYERIVSNKGLGVVTSLGVQPIYQDSGVGTYFLAIDGRINNREELKEKLLGRGVSFSEAGKNGVNQTELIGKLINQGMDIPHGIELAYQKIEGSLSLILMTDEGLYCVSDRFPLVLGKKEESYAVASESCSFPNLGYEIHSYPEPGELYRIDSDGIELIKDLGLEKKICAFLWMYTSNPASNVEGINVERARIRNGELLAKKEKCKFDIFAGVPQSGIPHSKGFLNEAMGKDYVKEYGGPLLKYSASYGRSYTPSTQEEREQIAENKLIANKKLIEGNKVGIMDDSIVRGTQLKNTTGKIWEAGAEEIHARIGSPPLAFPCKYNKSTRKPEELIFRRAIAEIEGEFTPDNFDRYLDPQTEEYKEAIDVIRERLNLTTLRYQTVEDIVEAIGLPKEQLCLHCWRGKD